MSRTKRFVEKATRENSEMQGKVADLSSSTMKKMTEELRSIEADIMAQLTELKRETRTPLRVYIYIRV